MRCQSLESKTTTEPCFLKSKFSCSVPAKNSKLLRKALEYLQKYPKFRKKIADMAYLKAKKEYSWESSAKKTKIIYNSLV